MDLAAPWHVGSSWTRDWICASCIGRQILSHWDTREVPWPLTTTKNYLAALGLSCGTQDLQFLLSGAAVTVSSGSRTLLCSLHLQQKKVHALAYTLQPSLKQVMACWNTGLTSIERDLPPHFCLSDIMSASHWWNLIMLRTECYAKPYWKQRQKTQKCCIIC